jgi:hypothetical protein
MSAKTQFVLVFVFFVLVVVLGLLALPDPQPIVIAASDDVYNPHGFDRERSYQLDASLPGRPDINAHEPRWDACRTWDIGGVDATDGIPCENAPLAQAIVTKVRHIVVAIITPTPTIVIDGGGEILPTPTVVVTSTPAPTQPPAPTATQAPTQEHCDNGAGNGSDCTPGNSSGSNQGQGGPNGDRENQGEQGNGKGKNK